MRKCAAWPDLIVLIVFGVFVVLAGDVAVLDIKAGHNWGVTFLWLAAALLLDFWASFCLWAALRLFGWLASGAGWSC